MGTTLIAFLHPIASTPPVSPTVIGLGSVIVGALIAGVFTIYQTDGGLLH